MKLIHCLLLSGISIPPLLLIGCSAANRLSGIRFAQAQKVQELRQEASLHGPGSNTIQGEPAHEFVAARRWLLVPASNVEKSEGKRIVEVGETIIGLATPLTRDGYVLTSSELVKEGVPVALNKMDARPARIVKVFPDSDFALVKFPYGAEQYFAQFVSDPGDGDLVFSDRAKGVVKSDGFSTRDDGIRSIECELPSISGQIGCPVANADGELVGVIVGIWQMRLTKRLTSTVEVKMVEPEVIRRVIEEDRKTNG